MAGPLYKYSFCRGSEELINKYRNPESRAPAATQEKAPFNRPNPQRSIYMTIRDAKGEREMKRKVILEKLLRKDNTFLHFICKTGKAYTGALSVNDTSIPVSKSRARIKKLRKNMI